MVKFNSIFDPYGATALYANSEASLKWRSCLMESVCVAWSKQHLGTRIFDR